MMMSEKTALDQLSDFPFVLRESRELDGHGGWGLGRQVYLSSVTDCYYLCDIAWVNQGSQGIGDGGIRFLECLWHHYGLSDHSEMYGRIGCGGGTASV